MTAVEFENHQVFDKLDQFQNRINEQEVRESIGIDNTNFFQSGEKYLRDRIKLTIPVIVQEGELTTIAQEIENSLVQINSYIGNKNIGHVNNAINHLHSAITRVRNLPLPFSKNDFNFSKAIAIFESTVQEKYKTLELENVSLKVNIEHLKSEITNNDKELQRINTLLVQKENEIQNLTSTFQTDYNNIKATANQNYEADRTTFRTEFDTLKQSANNEITVKASL